MVYGKIGTNEQRIGGQYPGEGWVEMTAQRPSPDYVAQADGTWGPAPAPSYVEQREAAILEKWPIPQQLEAHIEAAEDPPRMEKLNALLADVKAIKELYPKPL
ncbi:protein of unknown function [Pseudodesulfovibrio profundus]|uniref:Uncharacterized protein n=1 Tax=Pseudodesulfovibrio profundus TaxID=57320 RepID=A0A2C8FFI2_9BACT|nr:hypothetical protein [Pseudodesulfovibrio profundus]SOB60649.1 protein of unknown function [Pseudodesulfovibrio profundus]